MKVNIITGPFGCLPPYAIGAVEKLWYSIGTDMRNKGHQVIFISKKPLKESSMDDNLLLHGYERALFFVYYLNGSIVGLYIMWHDFRRNRWGRILL